MSEIILFQCRCHEPKKYRITLDGGSTGLYVINLCNSCYQKEDKQFMIKEEVLD